MTIIDKKVFESKTKNGRRILLQIDGYELVDSDEIVEIEALKHHFLIDHNFVRIQQISDLWN